MTAGEAEACASLAEAPGACVAAPLVEDSLARRASLPRLDAAPWTAMPARVGRYRRSTLSQDTLKALLRKQAARPSLKPVAGLVPVLITLVRHGETDDNRRHVLQGQIPTSLNDAGIRQGQLCAARIARELPDLTGMLSSDLPRALQTATLIREAYPRS
eukprot:RCo049335